MRHNLAAVKGEAPKTYSDSSKCIQIRQSQLARALWQHKKSLISKETIASCLADTFAPIRKLTFKSACSWLGNLRKRFDIRKLFPHQSLPCNDQQIGNAITIHRNLSRKSKSGFFRSSVQRKCTIQIGSHERNSKAIFRSRYAFASRKIVTRFAENKLGDMCQGLTHKVIVGGLWRDVNILKQYFQTAQNTRSLY